MRFKLLFIVVFFVSFGAFAQTDTTLVSTKPAKVYYRVVDTVALEKAKHVRDSLTWAYLKPDPSRPNQFVEQMLKKYITNDRTFIKSYQTNQKKSEYGLGKVINKQPLWVLVVMFTLIISFAVLKIVFSKELEMTFEAFYDNRVLSQINKEDNIFESWYFLFSFLLFSFLIGLFLYLIFQKYSITFSVYGFSLFIITSLLFALLLGFKILFLRFIAYIFQINKIVSDYVNIIYLSFFNVSLFVLPLTISIVFTVFKESSWILILGLLFIGLVFALQFLRILFQILSNYRFPKFYLILYLCALEICPIIVLIKALNI